MLRAVAVALGLGIVLAACRGAGSGQALELDGTWQLTGGSNAGAAVPVVAGRSITLVIDGDKVSGSACNLYGGSVAVSGSRITFSAMAMTEMACEEPMMSAEAAYHAALARVTTVARQGDILTLTGPNVELRYRRVPPAADVALVDTTWQLTSLITADVASSVLGDPATLRFDADGTLDGSTGCRSFSAAYAIDGARVEISGLATQKVLCTPELVGQDDHVLGVLAGPFDVKLGGTSLTVSAADGRALAYQAQAGPGGSGGVPSPSPTIANPDPIEPSQLPAASAIDLVPPTATIDGVAGRPVSWCWAQACADGAVDLAPNPRLPAAPSRLSLTSATTSLEVDVQAGAHSQPVTVPLGSDGAIGSLPDGSWSYLLVLARFADGGDALYAWSLVP